MVVGLGGAALPPRAKKLAPGGAAPSATGQDSSLAPLPCASHPLAAAIAAFTGATALEPLDTPSGVELAASTLSGQSNVRGSAATRHQVQQPAQQQPPAPQPAEQHAAEQPAVDQQLQTQPQAASQQPERHPESRPVRGTEQQQQREASPALPQAPQPASRKRKQEAGGTGSNEEGGRPRRSRLGMPQTAAGPGADAAPASSGAGAPRGSPHAASSEPSPRAKRRRSSSQPAGTPVRGRGRGRPSKHADILQRHVAVPANIFAVKTPRFFMGYVTKAEAGRKVPAVEVAFQDSDKYWFPVADVRRWMAAMVAAGTWAKHNPGAPPPAATQEEAEAAPRSAAAATAAAAVGGEGEEEEVARALQSLSTSLTSGRGGEPQPALSTGRQRAAAPAAGGGTPSKRPQARGGTSPGQLRRSGSGARRAEGLMAAVQAEEEPK